MLSPSVPYVQKPKPSTVPRVPFLALLLLAGLASVLFLATDDAAATHYRYGTLSWEPTGEPNQVRFTGAQAWRTSFFGNLHVGDVYPAEGRIQAGDGAQLAFYWKVISVNPVNDWFFATIVDANGAPGILHTYPSANNAGDPWVASWGSCCRISPHHSGNFHVNNPDQSERLETRVDLATGNSSPQTNLPPINPCPLDAVCSLPIPFLDADEDGVSFRMATASEAGDPGYVSPGPPHATHPATIDPATGIILWNTTGATYSSTEHTLYSIQVMLEDGTTKTPLDFFIELLPDSVAPPYWTPDSACGLSYLSVTGGLVQFTVTAQSDDNTRLITLGDLGLPGSATFTHASPGNPITGTFSWTPSIDDVGTHLVIFTAYDDRGYSTPSCPVTIKVYADDPPEFIAPTPCGPDLMLRGMAGIPLSFPVVAASANASHTVTVSMLSGPPGLTFTPGAPGNPTVGTGHWPAPTSGETSALFEAVNDHGTRVLCRVFFDIVAPSGQALSLAAWGGSAVPFSIDYATSGVNHRTHEFSTTPQEHRAALVSAPALGIRAEGLEEGGHVTIGPGKSTSHGRSEIASLTLAGGLIQAEGLVAEATLHWDGINNTTTVDRTLTIAALSVGGTPVPLDGHEQVIGLPGGGRLHLFEETRPSEGRRAAYAANVLHAYLPAEYGRAEIIIGSILLQGGLDVPFSVQAREILQDDDGDSGGDATPSDPVPLRPGSPVDGSLSDAGDRDAFRIPLAHGEKIQLVLQPALRTYLSGGTLFLGDAPAWDAGPPSQANSPLERLVLELYDPTGLLRDTSEIGLAGGPERIELNADITDEWTVVVGRQGLHAHRLNYTLAATVTPLPLLPQNDALSGADAQGACRLDGIGIPRITDGTWPGVLRDADLMDVYRFDAAIGDLVTVTLKPGETLDGVDMSLRLYDRTCMPLASSDIDLVGLKGLPEAVLRIPSQYTGQYYVGIERQNGVGNHYLTLRVQDPMPGLPNNDAGRGTDAPGSRSAAQQAPPFAFTGAFPEGDAGDAYLLPFDAGQREAYLVIDIGVGSTFSSTLYSPSGTIVPPQLHLANLAVYRFQPLETGLYGLELAPLVGGGDYLVSHGQRPAGPA